MNAVTAPTEAVRTLARELAQPGRVATWLNHWSVQRADWEALRKIEVIGVDGTFLQMVLKVSGISLGRTSADLVLPVLFEEYLAPGTRIAFIGAAPGVATRAAQRFSTHTIAAFDGYEELRELRRDPSALQKFDPQVIVLGLGARLQEEIAVEMHERFPDAIVCTAGGWIDQLAHGEQYFPAWIHAARLGWAWRIAHEPRRLIGRYTVDALSFLRRRKEIVGRLWSLPHAHTSTSLVGASA